MGCTCCLNCKDRYVDVKNGTNCHSTCPKYLSFLEENNKVKELKQKHRDERYSFTAAYSATCKKKQLQKVGKKW